jgi:limonene-1,2-epoxide hydrolase
MSNTEILTRFNSAWESFDMDAIMAFFAEDATFHMMPTRKATGHAEIRALIEAIIRPHKSASFEVLHTVEDATGLVMNERVDRFLRKDGKWVSIGVMGVFEFADGKIISHRDYFDMKTFTDQMADYADYGRPVKAQ